MLLKQFELLLLVLCFFVSQPTICYLFQSEIRSALDKVCYELPSTVRGDCDALVAEYTERIVEYLLAQFKPKALCTALGLCDAGEDLI